MAFRKKANFILTHKPDILIIPECEHPDKLKFEKGTPLPTAIFWYGTNLNKGLGVFSVIDCDSLTGINLYPTNSSFKLYPNPTDQFAILEFNNPTKQNCTLTLYDLHGQNVRTINNITADKVEIERQDLASGLYFFQLRTDRQIIATGKLTIE